MQAITVKTSSIHGKGVFAARKLPRGSRVGTYEGKPTQRNSRYVLWVEQSPGVWEGIRGTGPLKYLNHSTSPNCELDGAEVFACRPIPKGAELTFDYGSESGL